MGRVFYCTREAVQDAFDVKEAAHRSAQIDDAIASASDDIDGWLNRHKHGLAPQTATRYFPWPKRDGGGAYRLWFDENELISVTTFTAGGTVIAASDYFLEPVNSGPPYTYVELDLDSNASFGGGSTSQRAISIAGVWGIHNDQKVAGSLTEALDSSEAAVDVSDASLVGVGDVLAVEGERMLVTGRTALDTGDALGSAMEDLDSDRTVDVTDGTDFHVGETILIDNERMKIVDIAGNNLTVIRAYDGSVLADHGQSTGIWAYRTLTVERGALGTTAAAHNSGTAVTKWAVPDLARDLCKALVITRLEQEWSAYGSRVFSDEAERDASGTEVVAGRGLTDVRKACARRYKRKFRKAAV